MFGLAQLQTNVERVRAMGIPTERYILVNVPGARIETVENGSVFSRHTRWSAR
jgi:murein L,D-transpeptidase YcbB/YkuD